MKTKFEDNMPGGLADAFTPEDFDPKQLKIGIKVEMEHTSDPKIAREIAMDHLTEDPLYYQKLKSIEESVREYAREFLNEIMFVTGGISQELIDDLSDRGVNIYRLGSRYGTWDPRVHGLTKLQIEAILSILEEKIEIEKGLSPEESSANYRIEDIAVANVMGNKKNPSYIQKAKIYNISHLMDDIKNLLPSEMNEHWDRNLEKVLEPGEDLPWNNEEEPEFNKNPMNPYDANNSLSKVKANAHPKTQQAGVKKGLGTPGAHRNPGGQRQSTSSGY